MKLIDAVNNKDLDALPTMYTENIVWYNVNAGKLEGKETVLNFASNLFKTFSKLTYEVTIDSVKVFDESNAVLTS